MATLAAGAAGADTWRSVAEACLAGTERHWRDMLVCGDAIYRGQQRASTDTATLASLYARRGLVLHWMGANEEALGDLTQALALNPVSATTLMRRGRVHRSTGRFEAAVVDFNQAVVLSPHFARAYRERGFTALLRDDDGAALVDLDQAVTLAPFEPEAVATRGIIRYELGRWLEALDDFHTANRLRYAYDYLAVWEWLTMLRSGATHEQVTRALTHWQQQATPDTGWPRLLVRAFSVAHDSTLLAKLTEQIAQADLTMRQRREAWFYIGEWLVASGADDVRAKSFFQRALAQEAGESSKGDLLERHLAQRRLASK